MNQFKYSLDNKRYHTYNYYLKNKYHQKVAKVALNADFTCPNRDGTKGYGGCIFCSSSGSGDYAGNVHDHLEKQFQTISQVMKRKWPECAYIAYFQANTNTYGPLDKIKKMIAPFLNKEDVKGIALATRPDCLPDEVLDLLEEINEKFYVWVELGLQTVNDDIALKINRGYKLKVFEEAIEKLKKRNIDFVVHSILGLPGENKTGMLKTIDYIAHSGARGIKFHLLHLMKDTPMVKLYDNGELKFLSQEDYIDLICKGIAMLPQDMVVHRLTGDAPRNLLIGPMWSLKKWEILNAIDKALEENDIYQGKDFK